MPVVLRRNEKDAKLLFGEFQAKKSHSFEWLFLNAWSGKRDTYLVSDSLKFKGFLFFSKQEKT